ncbi:MAG: GTPase [Myxococcales bacterium]|nr:GTPase [Myxococcales bacterium]
MARRRIVILGAAGRDFHDFNVVFRDDPGVEVVAFTATQIPKIEGRRYPAELAGPHHPEGIPIVPEAELERLVAEHEVDEVVFSYSDVTHEHVMHLASRALAAGAGLSLLAPRRTMLRSRRPVVAVCAVRTGCGKSPACRYVARRLREESLRVAVVRHPMPYGDLARMRVQRFATMADLDAEAGNITIEEREEYEPHIEAGTIVFAGVDYAEILARAEDEADVILWDGGNNDLPFYRPDLWITLVDPHREGHERHYHPGEANLRAADVVVITKANTAPTGAVGRLRQSAAELAPRARVVVADVEVTVEDPSLVAGQRVLVIEDGPTLTHGGMAFGAGQVAAESLGATLVDPRPSAVGSIRALYERYPHLGQVLPAMGYYPEQLDELRRSIDGADCDAVLVATPVDLARRLALTKPSTRARYELSDHGAPALAGELRAFLAAHPVQPRPGPA